MKRSVKGIKLWIAVLSLVILVVFAGCVPNRETKVSETVTTETVDIIKIGVTHYGMRNELMVLISEAQKEMAEELGVEIDIFDADYDMNEQAKQFDQMIKEGYDAIIFSPVDSNASTIAVDKAYEAGVPVFGVNTRVNSNRLTSYIGSYDVSAGEMEMSQMALTLEGEGNIVILEGPIGSSAQLQKREGIHNILALYPDIEVIAELTANWSRIEAKALMQELLLIYPDQIDAVVGQNDEMALGAVDALAEAGLLERTDVIGVDGVQDGLIAVKEGHMDATIFQDAVGQGRMSVQVAVDYLNGIDIEQEYWIPYVLVTSRNVDRYLE